jgi:hypothetical protein
VLLKRTTLFLTGLGSLLTRIGLVGREERPSCGWALPDLRNCLLASGLEDVEAFKALVRCLVRGGEAGWATGFGPSSLRRALVKALSFIGTGISSSELSSWYCLDADLVLPLAAAVGAIDCWLSLRDNIWREGGRRRAWRCEVLRTRPLPIGVGDAVAMF